MRRTMAPLGAVTWILLAAGCASAEPKVPKTESWYEISFHGNKVGYVRAQSSSTVIDGKAATSLKASKPASTP